MKTGTLRSGRIRGGVQLLFFTYVGLLTLAHALEARGVSLLGGLADLHALCPFGAVETAGRLITQGRFIPKTHASNLWVFGAVALSTALFGSLFCGWLCPLGTVQDWLGKPGKKLWGRKFNRLFPPRLDRALGYLRYAVLAGIVVQTTRLLTLAFARLDPYYALFHVWTGQALPGAVVVLVLVLAASLFVARPWCRWFCPLGALLGLIQLVSPWKIRRRENCSACGSAQRRCPLNVDVCSAPAVLDTRCNRCGECLAACPASGCLDHALPGRSRLAARLSLRNRPAAAAVALILFAAPIAAARLGGLWRDPAEPAAAAAAAAALDADQISGELTLEQLAAGFDTSLESLKSYLGLPPEISGSTRLRDIEDSVETLTTPLIRERMRDFRPS